MLNKKYLLLDIDKTLEVALMTLVGDRADSTRDRLMTMLKQVLGHSELLEDKLFELVRYGAVVIPVMQLMHWTDTKRITWGMWRYVHRLFNEVLESSGEEKHGYRLYVGDGSDSYTFVIWDRGEGSGIVSMPWWNSIDDLEQPKKRKGLHIEEEEEEEAAAVRS